jgi:hypothetical protein
MKRLIVCLVLLGVSNALAQSPQTPEDGSWWKSLTPSFKLGYVSGYVRGAETANIGTIGGCIALWTEAKPVKAAYTFEQWKQLCFPTSDYDGVKMGQFLDGVDAFYADYRNQQIEFGSALDYVRDGIKGKSPTELESDLAHLRKCYADIKGCFAAPAKDAK